MNPPRILIVDDDAAITRLCQLILEKRGFHVDTALSASACLAALNQAHYDLLITDMRMPDMDGFEISARARAKDPEIAVVFITGYGSVDVAIKALRNDVDGLILKPFSETSVLLDTVFNVLTERSVKQDAARLKILKPLFNISEALFSEVDASRLEARIEDLVNQYFSTCQLAFYGYDLKSEQWKLISGKALEDICAGIAADCSTLFDQFFSAALPIVIDPVMQDSIYQTWINQSGNQAVYIPIRWGEHRYLVMLFRDLVHYGRFQISELDTAVILWRQVVIALENADLYTSLMNKVSELQESQKALIQAEKMAISGRLLGSLAHEINNPLQSVQNCLHLAQRAELSAEEKRHYIDLASHEVVRLSELVQNTLQFYRSRGIDFKLCSLAESLEIVLNLSRPQLQHSEIQVDVSEDIQQLPLVPMVPDQIQQVLLNLLLNAIDELNGLSGDACRHILIEADSDLLTISLIIEDSGKGIDDKLVEHVFEPFFTTKAEGTGLGLTIIYGIIVDVHHGSLLFEPPVHGHGARIRVTLPRG
jgi:signal transduction histidine kinase/FixJ family two-component response regulator